VVGLVALFSSYDHINLPGRVLPLQQQWGVWLIALSLPLADLHSTSPPTPPTDANSSAS
jgi:hypothetical protein